MSHFLGGPRFEMTSAMAGRESSPPRTMLLMGMWALLLWTRLSLMVSAYTSKRDITIREKLIYVCVCVCVGVSKDVCFFFFFCDDVTY
jgi:hypothetical protein